MSVVKGRRKESRFEAQHHFYRLRTDVTELCMLDFGFSKEKYEKQIEHYYNSHASAPNVEEVTERYRKKCESFYKWFIPTEKDVILSILRKIEGEFTAGNSIYPSETPAKVMEFIERRKHMNEAISQCFVLKQEINYIIRTLPVNLNKYERFADSIDKQIALYKGVRQSDNRLLKNKSNKKKFNN